MARSPARQAHRRPGRPPDVPAVDVADDDAADLDRTNNDAELDDAADDGSAFDRHAASAPHEHLADYGRVASVIAAGYEHAGNRRHDGDKCGRRLPFVG